MAYFGGTKPKEKKGGGGWRAVRCMRLLQIFPGFYRDLILYINPLDLKGASNALLNGE